MIKQASFLGISLRTLAHRRWLVVGYYLLLMVLVAIPIWRHKLLPGALLAQTFTIGALFGGISTMGPVKYYGEKAGAMDPGRLNPISLNLAGRVSPFVPSRLLDEREIATRDHAHYVAYRLLLLLLLGAFLFVFLTASWTLAFVERDSPNLLWTLLLVAMSLPQSVILWTEPEPMAEGALKLVEAKP